MRRAIPFVIFVCGSLTGFQSVYSETDGVAVPDSATLSQTQGDGDGDGEGELLLEEIEIKGRVEKPGVIIFPKRITPEIKEIEIDRSFEEEVKNGVGDAPQPEQALRELEPVNNIKKAVEKERK